MTVPTGASDGGPTASLVTPTGSGGVAVVELRGPGAASVAARVCAIDSPAVGRLRLVHPRAGGERLDEALLVTRAADRAELHVHGSPALVDELLAGLARAGARVESSHRPRVGERPGAPWWGAGVPDPAEQAWRAPTAAGARLCLDQRSGAFGRALERALAARPARARWIVRGLLARGAHARRLLAPPRVLLVGPTNAGKSTLFNLLAGEQRAIVSDLPGTTRDELRAEGRLGELTVEWIDTAGEGSAGGPEEQARVERAGQAHALELARRVDLVLRLVPLDALVGAGGVPDLERLDEPPRVTERSAQGAGVARAEVRRAEGARSAGAASGWRAAGDEVGGAREGDGGERSAASRPPVRALASRLERAPAEWRVGSRWSCPLEEPAATVANVEVAVRSGLGLPARAWRAGRAAPWCEAQQRALEAALAERDQAGFRARLEAFVASAGGGDSLPLA